MFRHQTQLFRYCLAIGIALVTLALRIALDRWIPGRPFLFFTPAVMFSAWYGGFGPGVATTATGALLGSLFLLQPLTDMDEISRMILFVLVGIQISWLSGQMHRAKRRAQTDAQAARRSERLYRTLASNFPDGLVGLFDADRNWTLVAGAGLDAAGLLREQMEARRIDDTLPPETVDQLRPMCDRVIAGQACVQEITHRSRVYSVHALPLKDSDASAHGGMIIFEDITELARARDELQSAHDSLEQHVRQRTAELHFQKTLLESQNQASLDGILAVGTDGRIIFANRRFSEMWNLPMHDGSPTLEDCRSAMRQQMDHQPQDPLSTDSPTLIIPEETADEISLKGGRTLERLSAPIVDPGGKLYGRVWFFRDVTERKRLQREIHETGERERQRIGQDLHDDLCQQLTGIACMARVLQQRLLSRAPGSSDPHSEAAAAMEIVDMVQRATQRARDLAKGLQPVNLQQQGLLAALQDLCSSIESMFHVSCRFRGEEGVGQVSDAVAVQLYRIAQEAITNAIRHGKASRVLVDLIAIEGRLIMTVEDNGTGIPESVPQHGLGLQTMNYRARMIGGTFNVERAFPAGTVVTCTLQLSNSNGSPTGPAPLPPAALRSAQPLAQQS